jgi:serine/threonine-protein kinase
MMWQYCSPFMPEAMYTDPRTIQPAWLDGSRPREGRYVLGPLLGAGGAGEVMEAWDVVLCRCVALKVLRDMEPTCLIRFMHEAQIQARLAHPHICRIYDVDSSDGTVKIAMQLIRGPSLEQAGRDLTLAAKVTLVAEIAEAVQAAHGLKLIHRDLKPSNILLEKGPNGRWIPYICDFGLAIAMDEPALTAGNIAMGTPAFMAPEQYLGERNRIGPATDIYGLGSTLHYLLLGRPPDDTGRYRILGLPMPERRQGGDRIEALPAELRTILGKCLEPDPGLRYPSAAALAEDLWRFNSGVPIQGSPSSLLARQWRRVRRHLRVTLGSALIAASLFGGWGLEWLALSRAHLERREAYRYFSREGAVLERSVRLERMLPAHDLRPPLRGFRARMEVIRARIPALGRAAQVPGHLALARVSLVLGDPAQARTDAEAVLAVDPGDPEAINLLATARARLAQADPGPVPARTETAQQVEALFHRGRGLGSDEYPRALVAFLREDYASAATMAGAVARSSPWDGDAVKLEAESHIAMAIQRQEAADLPGAEAECRAAMAVAQRFLDAARSDESAYHAYLLAARWLVAIQGDRGRFEPGLMATFEAQCEHALRLNPDNPGLQEDWLGLRFLKVHCSHGQAPGCDQDLNAALVFLGGRLQEPLPPALRQARMLILWAVAEQDLSHGRDPGPALAEALKSQAPAPFLRREYLSEVLATKARIEAAHGLDPRPTVADALARSQPELARHPGWTTLETAAQAWLIRGEWELAQGLDAGDSLRQCQALADQALKANPGARAARELSGRARLDELKMAPRPDPILRAVAQDRLRAASGSPPYPFHASPDVGNP